MPRQQKRGLSKTKKQIQSERDKTQDAILEKWPEFKCPIMQTIMKNPMVGPDGHTYEKEAIDRWLSTHSYSPMNPAIQMTSAQMAPNHVLRGIMARNGCACKGLAPPVVKKDNPLVSNAIYDWWNQLERDVPDVRLRLGATILTVFVFCMALTMSAHRERANGGSWPYEYDQGAKWKTTPVFNGSYVSGRGFCNSTCQAFQNNTCTEFKRINGTTLWQGSYDQTVCQALQKHNACMQAAKSVG